MASPTGRLLWLDLIRAIAAQMIVLHHLAFYGPIAARLGVEAPGLIGWFGEYARIAVQAFLVISGFLFAQSGLMRVQWSLTVVKSAVQRRYLRLFVPFMVAVICACLASVPVREWVGEPDWVSPWPDAKALLAHLTGAFDYLGVEALTVGAWYVSIDFQLHLLVVLMLWLTQRLAGNTARAARLWWCAVLGLAALSFFALNRDSRWDVTPFYFFGSFALGLAAGRLAAGPAAARRWSADTGAAQTPRLSRVAVADDVRFERQVAWTVFTLALVGLAFAPALRPAVALATALALIMFARGLGARVDQAIVGGDASPSRYARLIGLCGRSAYSLFLIHFPLAILVNGVYQRWFPGELDAAIMAALMAWLGALPLSWLMYRWVEGRVERALKR
jgi:peptidoglycan/LPS O-acetylase OafA/YrhL